MFCEAARQHGIYVVAIAIRSETDCRIRRVAHKVYWLSLSEFEKAFEIFRKENITKVVMAGQVSPRVLFSRQVRDSKAIQELFNSIGDRKANTIFGAIADRLAQEGLTLIDSTTFLQSFVPPAGVLTRCHPSETEWKDIMFGMTVARKIADLDIGLTVAVKHGAIVAVEALEGTDNLILRAGRICKGVVIVKAGRSQQDMRFDIPVIGPHTINTISRARGKCIAVEAKKTLIIDKKVAIELADRRGIPIVAL